jgi:SM-20-related protein
LQGRQAANGGSFCGGRTRRVVSFILYLNRGWREANGGALRIFPAYECDDGTERSQLTGHLEDILPEGGTLVLVMSDDVEHLVRETHAERQCVVGWFREYREEPVPDRDALSLRSWRDSSERP